MSKRTYFRANIHQNGPEILGVKMASRQGPSIKVQGPWRRGSFYRVSLSHCRRIKELASSVFDR
jgi:hypothetical protein